MKNKIYVIEKEAARGTILLATERQNEYVTNNNPVEYIRKDALLKWAKEKNARLDGTGGDYTEGYLHAMIDFIDKLKSM